jgi:hypothetical protein
VIECVAERLVDVDLRDHADRGEVRDSVHGEEHRRSDAAASTESAARLWSLSEEMTGVKFPF